MKPVPIHEPGGCQHAIFKIEDQRYAIGIESVQEIIRVPEITPIPGAAGELVGLINLRGNILPLFDARRCLQLPPPINQHAQHVIILVGEKGMAGLLVDEVIAVCSLEQSVEPEKLLPGAGQLDGSIEGISLYGDELVIRLNWEQLLAAKAGRQTGTHLEPPINRVDGRFDSAAAEPKCQ